MSGNVWVDLLHPIEEKRLTPDECQIPIIPYARGCQDSAFIREIPQGIAHLHGKPWEAVQAGGYRCRPVTLISPDKSPMG